MGRRQPAGATTDCFIEGPFFDADGNLYIADIPFGRIFKISPDKKWSLVVESDGWPTGLKISRDGRILVADYRPGDPVRRGVSFISNVSGILGARSSRAMTAVYVDRNDELSRFSACVVGNRRRGGAVLDAEFRIDLLEMLVDGARA
jgi:uncharacterized protein with von Willebrand factor type A (vWA) domain